MLEAIGMRGVDQVLNLVSRVWQRGEAGRLWDFETEARRVTERLGPLNRRSLGVRQVETSRIVGSVGRSAEFDSNFQPLHNEQGSRTRFQRVYDAMRMGKALPPIELYKLGRAYYVLDGHHRVGAACALGIETLDAVVTLFIPSGDPEAVRLYHERIAFEQATGLQSIGAAQPRTYRRLLTEVHEYRRKLADEQGAAIDLQFAALQWYARVFLPAFAALRSSNMHEFVPSLRHADMLGCLFEEERMMRRRLPGVSVEGGVKQE